MLEASYHNSPPYQRWCCQIFIYELLSLPYGTEDMVRERLRVYEQAGVNTLQVNPDGQTLDERLATLARLVELVKAL